MIELLQVGNEGCPDHGFVSIIILSSSPAPSDYVTVDENITFSHNESHYSLQLQIVDNTVVENTETFVISLSLPSNQQAIQLGTNDTASITITIWDDDCK